MVLVLGEILVDLIGLDKKETIELGAHVGGAPFNVAQNLANLGIETTFNGKVGDDLMGKFILQNLPKKKKLTCDIAVEKERNTTLAFFIKDKIGDGNFQFFRKNTADYAFNFKELAKYSKKDFDLIHFGSLAFSSKEARESFKKFARLMKKKKKTVSFDVNFREDIFDPNENYKQYYLDFIKEMDIVKFSEHEILMLSNKENLEDALKYFSSLKLIFVTLGKEGSLCFYKNKIYRAKGKEVKMVDAVGAGDAFYSGVISYLLDKDINNLSEDDIINALKRGNACGAITCQHAGATNAFKSLKEVKTYMED